MCFREYSETHWLADSTEKFRAHYIEALDIFITFNLLTQQFNIHLMK